MSDTTLGDLVRDLEGEVVGWRRHLHRNPELSFRERETARFVYETLESFGGFELSQPTPTSVVARLVGEGNESEFASTNPGRDVGGLAVRREQGA